MRPGRLAEGVRRLRMGVTLAVGTEKGAYLFRFDDARSE